MVLQAPEEKNISNLSPFPLLLLFFLGFLPLTHLLVIDLLGFDVLRWREQIMIVHLMGLKEGFCLALRADDTTHPVFIAVSPLLGLLVMLRLAVLGFM